MIQNPHIPGAFKCNAGYIILYGRQQSCCHLWKYRAEAGLTSSTAGQVVLCYHADDLISEARGLTWHHHWMEMNDPLGGHIVALPHVCKMEASLPSLSWRGKGSIGLSSCLLDWDR